MFYNPFAVLSVCIQYNTIQYNTIQYNNFIVQSQSIYETLTISDKLSTKDIQEFLFFQLPFSPLWTITTFPFIGIFGLLGWLYFKAHFGCHDTLMLGRISIKWRRRPDITIAV